MSVAEKIRFAEKHIKSRDGSNWSLTGREWVRDQFWLPADGWKLWRFADSEPCQECADSIGVIVDHPSDNPTTKCKCGGLASEPILVTVLNLERGDGKTFNLMAYSLATIFKARNKSIAALWASEDQGKQIFDEVWREAIEHNPSLSNPARCKIYGQPPQIYTPHMGSRLEVLTSSHRSLTGRRRTHIIVDEARDVRAQTLSALLPSTNAMHGVECPAGHVQLTPEEVKESKRIPKKCSACGQRLVEWWPRVIIASAAGVLKGNESDWLHELVEELESTPHKNYHLFTSQKWGRSLNPRKSEVVTSAIVDVFGKLPSTRHYVAAEYGNQWTRQGEDVMTPGDVKAVMDAGLHNEEGCKSRAIGFLDSSVTVEKTSLVILAEDEAKSTFPWEHVYMSYLEFWWPGHGRCAGQRTVRGDDVKQAIESVAPLYPQLTALEVDTGVGVTKGKGPEFLWPILMLKEIRQGSGLWRRKLRTWSGTGVDADTGWDLFCERVYDNKITLQRVPEILDEIKGITLSRPRNSDRRPHVTDRNRNTMHRDITQAIACLCWLIKREQVRSRRGRIGRADAAKQGITNLLREGGTAPAQKGWLKADWT